MPSAVCDSCIEAARPHTWNPDTYPINRYEVRDSTGDLVGTIVKPHNSSSMPITTGYVQCACDKQAQMYLLCISSSSAGGAVAVGVRQVTIESPPVGIYEVMVFGVDNSGTQFTESARFITKEG